MKNVSDRVDTSRRVLHDNIVLKPVNGIETKFKNLSFSIITLDPLEQSIVKFVKKFSVELFFQNINSTILSFIIHDLWSVSQIKDTILDLIESWINICGLY